MINIGQFVSPEILNEAEYADNPTRVIVAIINTHKAKGIFPFACRMHFHDTADYYLEIYLEVVCFFRALDRLLRAEGF